MHIHMYIHICMISYYIMYMYIYIYLIYIYIFTYVWKFRNLSILICNFQKFCSQARTQIGIWPVTIHIRVKLAIKYWDSITNMTVLPNNSAQHRILWVTSTEASFSTSWLSPENSEYAREICNFHLFASSCRLSWRWKVTHICRW